MSKTYTITKTKKFQRLSLEHYEYIISQVTSLQKENKGKLRNIGKTNLIRSLAEELGTTVSTIYDILAKAKITILDTHLQEHTEYSATAAFNKRNKTSKPSNAFKLDKALPFINLIVEEMKANPLSSIDETIHHYLLHERDKIEGLITICPKTFYNYVHALLIDIKPIDLPRTVQRKKPSNYKQYIPKRQKGTSIELRPKSIDDRSEFGHWEGDLVTGPRDGQTGALFTLLERKTRFYYSIKIPHKSSKQVYMQINKLNKLFGDKFSEIFKSITFDNGNEFARYKDIEQKPNSSNKRTTVYFSRPYKSCDRGSNENCNGLVRYFFKKGTDFNDISKESVINMNKKINNKKRKIHGYISAEELFIKELLALGFEVSQQIYI